MRTCCPIPLAFAVLTAASLLIPSWAIAQSSPAESQTTWRDLGFSQLPDDFSTDLIPLFERLNQARGTWSFKGAVQGEDASMKIQGSLQVSGNPSSGMFPAWQMAWNWPVDDPENVLAFNIMAGPRADGFDLMLIRVGPVTDPRARSSRLKVRPTPFQGTWDVRTNTITWSERDMPAGLPGNKGADDVTKKQTFEMVIAADGGISVKNRGPAPANQIANAKAILRTGDPPAEPVTLTGEHRFQSADEVLDQRIKPWLPSQATEITLLSERNGHYARYKISEEQFLKFLDELWKVDNGKSAHKRNEMGEGERGSPKRIAELLKTPGDPSSGNFKVYYSPSKPSAAMTTYFYDRETGIVYHDRGYW